MTAPILPENVTIRYAELGIDLIFVLERQREVSQEHIGLLRHSFTAQAGKQLVPIAVSEREDGKLILIDGAHRLEAAKQEGWMTIRAEIYIGLDPEQENVLEFVTNQARKNLSPVEILAAWESFDLPKYQLQAKENQAAGGLSTLQARGVAPKSPVIAARNNWESKPPISLAQVAIEKTGHDPRWIADVAEVRNIAEDESAPQAVREVAQRGFEKLKQPKAQVGPVLKEVRRVFDAVQRQQEDPKVLLERDAEDRLDEMVRHTTLLQEKLAGDLREFLIVAGRKDQMGRDMLRAVRVALVRAMTSVVVMECGLDGNASENLKTIGREVTKLLREELMKALGLEPARD